MFAQVVAEYCNTVGVVHGCASTIVRIREHVPPAVVSVLLLLLITKPLPLPPVHGRLDLNKTPGFPRGWELQINPSLQAPCYIWYILELIRENVLRVSSVLHSS